MESLMPCPDSGVGFSPRRTRVTKGNRCQSGMPSEGVKIRLDDETVKH